MYRAALAWHFVMAKMETVNAGRFHQWLTKTKKMEIWGRGQGFSRKNGVAIGSQIVSQDGRSRAMVYVRDAFLIFVATFALAFGLYWLTDIWPPYNDVNDIRNLAMGFASGCVITWSVMR